MIRVLIADDHSIVREGVKQILADSAGITVTGEAENGNEALEKALKGQYDLMLLDITMPGLSGIEILEKLRAGNSKLPVLVLSIHPEGQFAFRALKAGAAGYLTKDTIPENLILAIRTVASGKKYLSDEILAKLISLEKSEWDSPAHEALTSRENEVMRLLAQGKSVKEISLRLSISNKTVSMHRTNILEKMKLNNNSEITRYAIEHGLIE